MPFSLGIALDHSGSLNLIRLAQGCCLAPGKTQMKIRSESLRGGSFMKSESLMKMLIHDDEVRRSRTYAMASSMTSCQRCESPGSKQANSIHWTGSISEHACPRERFAGQQGSRRLSELVRRD